MSTFGEQCRQQHLSKNSLICAEQDCTASAIMCGEVNCCCAIPHALHHRTYKLEQFNNVVDSLSLCKQNSESAEKVVRGLLHKLCHDAEELLKLHEEHLRRYPGNKAALPEQYELLRSGSLIDEEELTGDAFYRMWHELDKLRDLCSPYIVNTKVIHARVEHLRDKVDRLRAEIAELWSPAALHPYFDNQTLTSNFPIWNETVVHAITLKQCKSDEWKKVGDRIQSLPSLTDLYIEKCFGSDELCESISRSSSILRLRMSSSRSMQTVVEFPS